MHKLITAVIFGTFLAASAALADHHENDALIEHAMAAAPPAISGSATIMLYDGTVLREGTNGWTCLPGFASGNDDASCNDAAWTHYFRTDTGGDGEKAEIKATGVSYMLASDTPHVMIIVPEAGGFEGLNTEPGDGKAWVMWADLPGRHIMIPIGLTGADEAEEKAGEAEE